jgi:subtilisin family serine protease
MRTAIAVVAVVALLAATVRADLFHVRTRAPAPELAGMAGVQSTGADDRLFLVDAIDEHDLAAQMNAAVGERRRFDGSAVVVARVQPVALGAVPGSWGQDRVDQRWLPLDNSFAPPATGAGATVWVVDTGVDAAHAEFAGGRASNDFSVFASTVDCHGHGTHVSSTAAGVQYGVAPGARLRAIKVLDCSGGGSTYGVAQGLAYVLAHLSGRDVINLSLGYGARDAVVESIIADLVAAGAIVVAAAGNSGTNACNHFPSAHAGVLAVAATTSSDARASFSNYGSCVSLFAPGANIRAALRGGGSTTMSGTSMASPHVAGAVALLLERGVAPADAPAALLAACTAGAVSSVAGSPNRLLFVESTVAASASRTPSPSRAAASASRTPSRSRAAASASRTPSASKQSRTPSRTPKAVKNSAASSAAVPTNFWLLAALAAGLLFVGS